MPVLSSSRLSGRFWAAVSMVAAAAFARLLPHPANVTPIVAIALFSGAVISRRSFALVIPLIALFVSDLGLGFHNQMAAVYGSIVLISMIGFWLAPRQTVTRVVGASLLSSILFFVVTNLSVWLSGGLYVPTLHGLIECYTMALPFFRNAVVGDLAFSGVLFGAWALATARVGGDQKEVKGTCING